MKFLLLSVFLVAPAFAQDEVQQARERFESVATLAAAYLHSAESIEARLNEDGATLHPQIAALCHRIAATLDQAHDAIDRGSLKSADRALTVAEALVERLSKKLGG